MGKFVVVGRGLIGGAVASELRSRGTPYLVLDRHDLDLASPLRGRLEGVLAKGDVLINAAGLTDVDTCENAREIAMRVNGLAPGELAAEARTIGAAFIHISSDAVIEPTNVYAESKVLGEHAVLEGAGDDALVLRVSTVFGPHRTRRDFVRWVAEELKSGRTVRAATDMYSSPTYSADAAKGIVILAGARAVGTRQFANHAGLSRCEFASMIQTRWQLGGTVVGVRRADLEMLKAKRPLDTRMRADVAPLYSPISLEACLDDYLERLKHSAGMGSGPEIFRPPP